MSIKVTGIKFPLDNRSRRRDKRKNNSQFSISKMLRTPVLRKGRKVKHHYKAFRTVLSMMVEFNLARQVLGVKHNLISLPKVVEYKKINPH